MAWDPAQYLKFAGPRLRPALDLLQRIDFEAPSSVYDIGAGAGNVTRLIAARWPEARVVGVDSSAEMLAKAAAENPQIEWQEADLATWRPRRPADIIYSNAALHWLDGHDRLFIECQPGHVQHAAKGAFEPSQRDVLRAERLRVEFAKVAAPDFSHAAK